MKENNNKDKCARLSWNKNRMQHNKAVFLLRSWKKKGFQ